MKLDHLYTQRHGSGQGQFQSFRGSSEIAGDDNRAQEALFEISAIPRDPQVTTG